MKRVITSLLPLFFLLMVVSAQNNANSVQQQNQNYTPTYSDSVEEGETVVSYEVESEDDSNADDNVIYKTTRQVDINELSDLIDLPMKGISIAILSMLLVFGVPLIIVVLALYFNYKNRKNKYRMMEKAIESGQPLPQEFLNVNFDKDMANKGIKNMCLGAGLFIFLWAVTVFAIGCIGLIIFFNGLGQYIVAQRNSKNKKDDNA